MDEIDEVVDWQLSGLMNRKAPTFNAPPTYQLCPNCKGDWHGLPTNNGCKGSFATPE